MRRGEELGLGLGEEVTATAGKRRWKEATAKGGGAAVACGAVPVFLTQVGIVGHPGSHPCLFPSEKAYFLILVAVKVKMYIARTSTLTSEISN